MTDGDQAVRPRRRLVVGAELVALALAAALLTALCAARFGDAVQGEPDRYYHLAVSRMMVEQGGFLDGLPQADDLGWQQAFPDKETLFHVVTALAYRLGGEGAVTQVPLVLCFGVLFAAMALGRREAGALAAAVSVACLVGLSPNLGFRLLLLRPHSLAMLAFLLLLGSLRTRRAVPAALCCAMFALAYHTLYLPLGALVVHGALEHLAGRSSRRVLMAGALGLVLGVLLNPAFPGSLALAWQHVQIALGNTDVPPAFVPLELLPLTTQAFVRRAGAHALVLVVAVAWAGMSYRRAAAQEGASAGDDRAHNYSVVGLGVLGLALWVPRALEYAMPCAALAACVLVGTLPKGAARAGALAALVLWGAAELRRTGDVPDQREATVDVLKAIESAPSSPLPMKVINLHWQDGAFVLYARPDLQFVDLLDPSLLGFYRPELGPVRHALADRRVPDVAGVAQAVFHAQLLLARDHELVAWLSRDPELVRLYPRDDEVVNAALFQIDVGARARFVTAWDGAPSTDFHARVDAMPPRARLAEPLDDGAGGSRAGAFLRLDRLVEAQPGAPRCALVAPTVDETARLAGATVLGLGGGPWMRVALDGAPLVDVADDDPRPGVLQHALRLPRPLEADDDLEVLVCAHPGAASFGLALSLWRDQDVARLCPADDSGPFPVVIGGATGRPLCAVPRAAAR